MIPLGQPGLILVAALLLGSCGSSPSRTELADRPTCETPEHCPTGESARRWALAREAEQRAGQARFAKAAAAQWLACSIHAYPGWHTQDLERMADAARLATRCTEALLRIETQRNRSGWSAESLRLASSPASLELRGWQSPPSGPVSVRLASAVAMDVYGGKRHAREGFGVPLTLLWPRCADVDYCQLLPPEGLFRDATAWIEPTQGPVRLVLADSRTARDLLLGTQRITLARDTSAAYARGIGTSKLSRLALFGLLGGREVGRRAGVYLLQDYDPDKQPVVMIHGLGSSPLVWARLSNDIWGDPALAQRYQVWHVVYQTNAPLLVTRLRIERYLDEAWRILDPEADDPAREAMVLVGHSLGGVLSRLLASDSGDVLWNAAFTAPLESLTAAPDEKVLLRSIFWFQAYPGVSAAVFLAAPHRGAPAADGWRGRLSRVVVGRRAPEIQALKRVAALQPEAVVSELRDTYLGARVNSISTLQTFQPVRLAGESLLPAPGIRYHNVIGIKPGAQPAGDGVVPVVSAELPGAASTRYVPGDHSLPTNALAIGEVLRILREPATGNGQTMP